MKTICITSYKGGVGKTLISFNFGAYLYNKGYRVLVVDLDGQGNMTRNMMPSGKKISPDYPYSTKDIYTRPINDDTLHPNTLIFKNPLEKYEGFDVIISHPDLKESEDEYKVRNIGYNLSLVKWIKRYRKELENMYDFIILDSSPNLSVGTYTALTAADEIFLITDVSANSLNGAMDLFNKWDYQCENLNYENKISLVFANNVDVRQSMGANLLTRMKSLKEENPEFYCENHIKYSSKIKNSEINGPVAFESSADYRNNSGVISMMDTFDEIMRKRGLYE